MTSSSAHCRSAGSNGAAVAVRCRLPGSTHRGGGGGIRRRITSLAGAGLSVLLLLPSPGSVAASREPAAAAPEIAGSRPGGAPGGVFRDCGDCPEMVVVPAGGFVMGSDAEDSPPNQRPAHQVRLAKAIAVGLRKVSFDEWKRCSLAGLCAPRRGGNRAVADRPVVGVSWLDVQQFLAWLTVQTGMEYRLLSEAEWEYIAGRAMGRHGGRLAAAPVDLARSDRPGLEWLSDCWHADYVGAPGGGESWDRGGDCRYHVVRGDRKGVRARSLTKRHRFLFNATDAQLGFRVARALAK